MKIVRYAFASVLLILAVTTAGIAQDPGWPRQRTENGNILVMYQPQVDDWKDFKDLEWRMAVSLTPAGGKAAVGVVALKGDTEVDHENEMVSITNLKITKTNFPSLDQARAAEMDRLVKTFLPQTISISLHRLVACIPKKEPVPGVQLKNDPPTIFVNTKPSILLDVDGQPVRASIRNTDLEYVVNTRWPLFFDKIEDRILSPGRRAMASGGQTGRSLVISRETAERHGQGRQGTGVERPEEIRPASTRKVR